MEHAGARILADADAKDASAGARQPFAASGALTEVVGERLGAMDAGGRVTLARQLQRQVGNRAATRRLARKTLKEKVEEARKTDPAAFVLKAVTGMTDPKFSASDRLHEITWRMIWMYLPERINNTLVTADTSGPVIDLDKDPPAAKGDTTVKVGAAFVDGITADNLMDRVAILKAVFHGSDKLKEKLKSDIGFGSVVDGTASWKLGELAMMYAGLTKMAAADRVAMSGVTLKRESVVMEHGKSMDGLYEVPGFTITGAMTTAPAIVEELRMADSAFTDPDRALWVAVHEAGHGVDSHVKTEMIRKTNTALVSDNVAVTALNAAAAASRTEMNTRLGGLSTYRAADRSAARTFTNAVLAAHNALNTYSFSSNASNLAANEAAADRAVAARDTALAALPAGNPAAADFAATITLQNAWMASAKARAATMVALADARTAQTAASGTVAGVGTVSKRLADFVAVVNTHSIAPITPYARENWPAHPEEFFAEAYTMWLNKPKELDSKAPALKKFFDDGKHQ